MLGRCAKPKVGMDKKSPYSVRTDQPTLDRSRQPLGLSVIQSEECEETEASKHKATIASIQRQYDAEALQ